MKVKKHKKNERRSIFNDSIAEGYAVAKARNSDTRSGLIGSSFLTRIARWAIVASESEPREVGIPLSNLNP